MVNRTSSWLGRAEVRAVDFLQNETFRPKIMKKATKPEIKRKIMFKNAMFIILRYKFVIFIAFYAFKACLR